MVKKQKGNPRVSRRSAAAREGPGDPNHPATFISCHEREGKTAAYVGYANTEDLRRVVLCWPVLLAVVQINRNPKYTNGSGAFKLLNDDLESYKDIDDAAAAFPLTGSEARQKTAANKRLAAILSKMIQDFALMSTLDRKDNKARQKAAMVSYQQEFPDRANVPLLVASMCRGPTLGPREDAHDLEAHNRFFMLTKYFKYCHRLKIEAFQNRFPEDGNFKGSKVPLNMVPAWMRPKTKTADPKFSKSEAMRQADSLSKKTFTLCYLPRLNNPDSRDDVEENFEKAEGDGVERLVAVPRDFWINPRLYDSLPSLRDQIRRQLRCHIFRTNLHAVLMKYKRKEADGIFDMSADLLNGDWIVIEPILNDEANDGFDVQVGLWARDYESTQNIFEEFDVPPHLCSYS